MNTKQIQELKTCLKEAISQTGRVDTESLSKAILRATELVAEEQEQARHRNLKNWLKARNSEDPVSRFVLRIANLFPCRPMLNGLLCSLIIFTLVAVTELSLVNLWSWFHH
jgi:hypothetical protein